MHAVKLEELERRLRNDLMHEAMAWGGRLLLHRDLPVKDQAPHQALGAEHSKSEDDITTNEDINPSNAITAFWDSAGDIGDIDVGLATPMEVYQSLAAEGYQMSHRRAPLSRERTPEAADLDVLYHQLLIQPEGE